MNSSIKTRNRDRRGKIYIYGLASTIDGIRFLTFVAI